MSGPTKLNFGLKSILSAVSIGALALAVGVVALNTDRTIEFGVAAALEDSRISRNTLVAGSEDFWLRQPDKASGIERVEWVGPVATGGTLVTDDASSIKTASPANTASTTAQSLSVTRIDMDAHAKPAPVDPAKHSEGHGQIAPYHWIDTAPAHKPTSPVGL